MKDSALRVCIVGCGYGAQVLAPAFRSDRRVRIVAISSQTQAKAQQNADALAIPEAFGNWRGMLNRDRVDAVAIATPPDAQPEIALTAFGLGISVFAEKPLAPSIDAANALVHAARTSGQANVIDFNFREIEAFRNAHDTVRSGVLGSIRHVAVSWHVESYANQAKLHSWKTDIDAGGGALSNFVSHSLDYLEWMFGPIVALCAHLTGMPNDPRRNDTVVGLMLRFEGGAAGTLVMSAAAYRGSGHRIEIYGEDGSLVLVNPGPDYMRGFRLLLARRPNDLAPVEVSSSTEDSWQDGRVLPASRLAKRFTDWALGDEPCEPSFAAGLRVQTLLEAARQSSNTGIWIDTSAHELA